jgi:hypothetical protein
MARLTNPCMVVSIHLHFPFFHLIS